MYKRQAYKEETGVEVTVTPIASDSYSTKIQATIAGGNNPDLAFVDAGVQSTQLAAKGKLLGLNQFGVCLLYTSAKASAPP